MSVQTGKQSKLKMMAIALVTCASMTIIPVASASAAEADVIAPTTESGEYGIRPMWLNPEGKHTQYPAQGGIWEWGFWNNGCTRTFMKSTVERGLKLLRCG